METEGVEVKDSISSTGETGVNKNKDDEASGSSCHETMETNSSHDKPSTEPIAGPSCSTSDGSQSSSSKSNEKGLVSFALRLS